jgi:GAF domain-containing protein
MLVEHLVAARKLQQTSTKLIEAGEIGALYELILDAAAAIMRSDIATMQRVDEANGELVLLGYRGISSESASIWQRVPYATAATPCALATRTGRRVLIADYLMHPEMQGTKDLEQMHAANMRSGQSTPLQTRDGRIVGLISTHWRSPHTPSRRELANLDVLARQAADLIERTLAEEQRIQLLRSLEEERRLVQELPAHAMVVDERVLLVPLIGTVNDVNIVGFARSVLQAVRRQRARVLVLDVTGVQHVDDEAVDWVVKLSNAVRLMGSEIVAAGFDADFAAWRPAFRFNTDGVVTVPDVREALSLVRNVLV